MVEMVHTAVWPWLDQAPYKPVFPQLEVSGKLIIPPFACGTGFEVSPGGFFENSIIQGEVSDRPLQARAFLL